VQCLRNRLRGNSRGASGDKFVVSKAGQVYDAPESEPNRKPRLQRHLLSVESES
jgi:hypothetical protein